MSTPEAVKDKRIELRGHDGTIAVVNPNGAFLESLEAPDGTALLFPRQVINGKDRGGVPVCAPVFGPGDKVGLAQHGFARNVAWQIIDQNENGISLSLANPNLQDPSLDAWADSEMLLDIILLKDELRMDLLIANNGDEPFVASPGFHPYFPIKPGDRAEEVSINGNSYTRQELLEARVLSPANDGVNDIELGDTSLKVRSSSLTVLVVWSANPDLYICAEPTSGGFVTKEGSQADLADYMCNPGDEKQYSMSIKWGS